jgi:exocyst complex component 4
MAAFRDAGETNIRRRELANGNEEGNYELERRSEAEREKARQDRIKERMPYRKPTANAKTGEIDAILDQIRDEWEFVIDPDVSMVAYGSGRVVEMLMTSPSSTT